MTSNTCSSKHGLEYNHLCLDNHKNESKTNVQENNNNYLIKIETSFLPSRDKPESKLDDDRSQIPPHLHDDQCDLDDNSIESLNESVPTSHKNLQQENPPPPPSQRKKSNLSVRTLDESLSSIENGCTKESKLYFPKEVSFSKIQIREYQIQLENNPACAHGPPIGIGWNYSTKDDINLKDFFDKKVYVKLDDKPPGPYDQIYIKPHDRLAMLKNNGYTDQEICECIVDVRKAKKERIKSMTASEKEMQMAEVVNNMQRKFTKLIRSKERRKYEDLLHAFSPTNDVMKSSGSSSLQILLYWSLCGQKIIIEQE